MENMTELCNTALKIIADSDNPIILIRNAMEEANKLAKKNLIMDLGAGKDVFLPSLNHSITGKFKGWEIRQNKIFRHYILVDPEGKEQAGYFEPDWRGPNFKYFLDAVISLKDKFLSDNTKMHIFYITTSKDYKQQKGITTLILNEALQEYPNTKNIFAGYYTNHPADERALTRIENYFSNLVLDQDDERVILLGKMGAKSVEIQRLDQSSKNNNTKMSVDIPKVTKAGIGISIGNELLESSYLKVEFEGTVTSPDKDLLNRSVWFKNDSRMNSILDARLTNNNKMTKYELKGKSVERYNFDFNIAANILGVTDIELQNEYKSVKETVREFNVIFPN